MGPQSGKAGAGLTSASHPQACHKTFAPSSASSPPSWCHQQPCSYQKPRGCPCFCPHPRSLRLATKLCSAFPASTAPPMAAWVTTVTPSCPAALPHQAIPMLPSWTAQWPSGWRGPWGHARGLSLPPLPLGFHQQVLSGRPALQAREPSPPRHPPTNSSTGIHLGCCSGSTRWKPPLGSPHPAQ